MTVESLILFLIIGLVAGWLAGRVIRGKGFGLLGNLIVGVLGAIIGGYLFDLLGIGAGGIIGQIVVAFIGAIVLIFILSLLRR